MQDTGCLGLVHGDDPEKCYGEEGGSGVHIWKHMYTRGGFMSMYGKTNTKRVKIKNFLRKAKKKKNPVLTPTNVYLLISNISLILIMFQALW